MARFVYLSGSVQPELVVAIHRLDNKAFSKYRVTITEPSAMLWDCIPTGDEKFTGRIIPDPGNIRILRWDALLPESTASAIHSLWMAMLSRTAADPCTNCILTDSSKEIFSASDSRGKLLQAQVPIAPKENTTALVNLAFSLANYARSPASRQPKLARKIEETATELLRRVSKNHYDIAPKAGPRS
jgi:hypothetical protein